MHKLEALTETYGDYVGNVAVNYLTKQIDIAETIETLNNLMNLELGDQALKPEDIKMIETCIDGPNLFSDDEYFQEHEKKHSPNVG
jgi:hypothetical protein